MEAQLTIFHNLYQKTTKNWKGRKPTFTKTVKSTDNSILGEVYTQDKIYRFLHDGTKTRWALMSPDWVSQTTPRLLSSNPGQGFVVMRGKGIMQAKGVDARPGIQAREWTQEIIKQHEKKFHKAMTKALFRGALGG
jgi:hypothetical protein